MGQIPTSVVKLFTRRSAIAITRAAIVGVNIIAVAMPGSLASFMPPPSQSGSAMAQASTTLSAQKHTMLEALPILNFGNLSTPDQMMKYVHFTSLSASSRIFGDQ